VNPIKCSKEATMPPDEKLALKLTAAGLLCLEQEIEQIVTATRHLHQLSTAKVTG
jgi:hypothetical protein